MKLQHQNQAKELDIIKFQHQENDYIKCVCCEDNWRKKKANLSKICLQLLEDKKKYMYTKVTSNPSCKLGGYKYT